MVVDANTGAVLHNRAGDEKVYPASLTKMMTLYMTFELIELGRLDNDSTIKMTQEGADAAPSKLELEPGEELPVLSAIKALITKSANDVAIALAMHIGGTETNFARLMTNKARDLGMPNTTFRNASGLPDPEQTTTARDMITLGCACRTTSRAITGCSPRAASPTAARTSATTIRCSPAIAAPTASRRATRAPPASTS